MTAPPDAELLPLPRWDGVEFEADVHPHRTETVVTIEDAETYATAYATDNVASIAAENQRLREALEIIANLSMSQFYKPQDLGNAAIKLASAALQEQK